MDLKVHINNIHGSQMAAKITGNFIIDENEFRFTAIAFGRIGGQNVGAKISKTTEKELEKYYHTPERIREHEDMKKFIKWVSKKEPDFKSKNKRSKRKR